ncbi:hypothetical protein PHMEG_00015696 [Phytophthora megakarya]|uniref:Peptidase A2 domain-containing protein n=1 Tax=Phytophthora megakarya TaxID=4795 RepID=A0A225W0L6_9STRA|nr:hypothetical protein PHMEG_00015696 [Phytophthora megakarya]
MEIRRHARNTSIITSKRWVIPNWQIASHYYDWLTSTNWRKFSVRGNELRVDNTELRSGRNFDRRSRPALRQRQPVPRYARSKRMNRVPGISGFDGSASEEEKLISTGGVSQNPDPARSRANASEGARISDRRSPGDRDHQERERCSHCGSRKHTYLDCWKRLICEKCGKRGHPTDRCLYACRGCGDVHEAGECPMEEFYNRIRQCFADHRAFKANWHKSFQGKLKSDPRRRQIEVGRSLIYAGRVPGYWKRHSPGKWFRQAKISGRTNHERATLLLDTGADVSILDITFGRKECVGIGDNVYTTGGRTKIKITLVGYLAYFFDIWIGDLSGQNAILGMDFMVPAGVRMDLADGSMRLRDEVGIPIMVVRSVILERSLRIPVGRSEETAARIKLSAAKKLWVSRGERWVPTMTEGPGRIRYLVISNIGEEILRLDHRLDVGMILDQDKVPRSPGFVSAGSRRYREWQNLAFESTVDVRSDPPGTYRGPCGAGSTTTIVSHATIDTSPAGIR